MQTMLHNYIIWGRWVFLPKTGIKQAFAIAKLAKVAKVKERVFLQCCARSIKSTHSTKD
jgi:hypothetical protein